LQWTHELVSLSGGPVKAEANDGRQWSPKQPGLELRRLPESPLPAATEGERLRQLEKLARRFSGGQMTESGELSGELRLLPRPLLRYADPEAGLLDGALYALAIGTNPEVLIVLEARRDGRVAAWHYGLAR